MKEIKPRSVDEDIDSSSESEFTTDNRTDYEETYKPVPSDSCSTRRKNGWLKIRRKRVFVDEDTEVEDTSLDTERREELRSEEELQLDDEVSDVNTSLEPGHSGREDLDTSLESFAFETSGLEDVRSRERCRLEDERSDTDPEIEEIENLRSEEQLPSEDEDSDTDPEMEERMRNILLQEKYENELKHLNDLKQQLEDYTHPEYVAKKRRLEKEKEENLCDLQQQYQNEVSEIESEYKREKAEALRELEKEKGKAKMELRAKLMEKKTHIELDKFFIRPGTKFPESLDYRPISASQLRTMKLSCPGNLLGHGDMLHAPGQERTGKRKFKIGEVLNLTLDKEEIEEDLKRIRKKPARK